MVGSRVENKVGWKSRWWWAVDAGNCDGEGVFLANGDGGERMRGCWITATVVVTV